MKPDAGYSAVALACLDQPPAAVLLVDDKAENVQAARRAGMAGVEYHLDAGVDVLRDRLRGCGVGIA